MLRPRPLPSGFVPPLRPTLVAEPPSGEDWLHEIKHDGNRTLVAIGDSRARAFTRNGHDWSARYPRIVAAAAALPCRSALIDGEAIVQDSAGVSDFLALGRAMAWEPERIVLFAFDLLMLGGEDLRSRPLVERRARLRELLGPREAFSAIQFSADHDGDGATLFKAADRMGLEGIVSKRAGSKYRSGRTRSWLKTKCVAEGDFVVLGTVREPGSPALALLAREEDGRLLYAGSAFVTLKERQRDAFWRRTEALAAERPVLPLRNGKASWCRPELRVRVRHLKGSGLLRHAALMGQAE